jgi:hypothetical protein
MADRRVMLVAVTLVTFLMVLSSLGLLAAGYHAPGAAPGSTISSAATSSTAPGGGSSSYIPLKSTYAGADRTIPQTATSVASVDDSNPAVVLAQRLITEKKLNPSSVFFPAAPNPASTPGGIITPSAYITNPSPMGIADLGQGTGGPYVYNTSSFDASISLNSFQDYNPGYAGWTAPPNYMTWQLNTVTVNVSIPGDANGVFWIQNVVHFNGTTLQFENNIWNMSSKTAALNPGTLLNYNGTLVPGSFYYTYGPTFQVTYPFTLNLFNNITSRGGHPGVYFNYSLTNTTNGTHIGSFDYVTFNGTASHSAPPSFEVNGKKNNPLGLYWDSELIFGGNGGGANAVITNLSGTSTLQYWDKVTGHYANVPSAYDYGVNTGETADGLAAAYVGTTELLSQGPSFLVGLWNTSNTTWGPAAQPGWINVDLTGLPNYGFVFGTNQSAIDFTRGPTSNLSYAPSDLTGVTVTHLPPPPATDPYVFRGYANGHDNGNITVSDNATGSAAFSLTANSHFVYTPIYLSTTAQVAAFGGAGIAGVTYNAGDNGLWINNTQVTMGVPFNFLNDFRFPEFMLFAGLNLSVDVSLNHLVQNPYSFTYYKYNSYRPNTGVNYYAGLTQGYFFNFGSGQFTVTNTSVYGSSYLVYVAQLTSLASVEFWQTNNSRAGWITTDQDSFGVAVENSTYAYLWNITGQGGANAIAIFGSEYVVAQNIVSNGTDGGGGQAGVTPFPTWGAYLEYDALVEIDGMTASNGSVWIFAVEANDIYLFNFTATNNLVQNGAGPEYGFLGLFEYIEGLEMVNFVADNSSGYYAEVLDLVEVDQVLISGFTVTGTDPLGGFPGSGIVGIGIDDLFTGATAENVTVTDVTAGDNAIGLIGEFILILNVSDFQTYGGATGMILELVEDVQVWDISSTGGGFGVWIQPYFPTPTTYEPGDNVSVWNVSATQGSLGGLIELTSDVVAWNFNATSPSLQATYVAVPNFNGALPDSALTLLENTGESASNISTDNMAFGVLENYSAGGVAISNVTSWNGISAVSLNTTASPMVSAVFAYGNEWGATFENTTFATLTASTFEGSSSYGVSVTGGHGFTAYADNFVANNGASTDGTFSASHVQAAVTGSIGAAFDFLGIGNYWSDWSGSGSYAISGTVSDSAPLSAFVSNWLKINETGLPVGTAWGFTLDTVTYSTSAPLVFIPSWTLSDASLGYVVNPPPGFSPSPAAGTIVYTGANQTVTISFVEAHYTVAFGESGLPSGAMWSVTFNGTTTSAVSPNGPSFSVYPGTYNYTVIVPANYTALPSNGNVVVTGSARTIPIAFTHVPVQYSVTFTESGLPSGTSWSVVVDSTSRPGTGTSIVFSEYNGTYGYTVPNVGNYSANPSEGNVNVVGSAVTVTIAFSVAPVGTYAVTFTETGLTSGTSWSMTVGTSTLSSTTDTIVFHLANGTLSWTVDAVAGYTIEQATGSVDVQGLPQMFGVAFVSTTTYTLTFTESGLPSGTNWSVTVGTVTHSSTVTTITFQEPSGMVDYSIGAVSGYTASQATGTVTLTGAPTGVQVTFTTTGSTNTSSGGLTTIEWILIGLVIAIIVIVLIVALVMRGRGGSTQGTATPAAEQPADGETYNAPAPWSEETPPGGSQ